MDLATCMRELTCVRECIMMGMKRFLCFGKHIYSHRNFANCLNYVIIRGGGVTQRPA